MDELRLGDVIDDFCVKCRRVTNHSIVSLVNGQAAKVRCRTCYHDHDYRHEQPPPSKKDLKKAELFNQVLGNIEAGGTPPPVPESALPASETAQPASESALPASETAPLAEEPKKRGRGRKSAG
jgi:hypothetical protein